MSLLAAWLDQGLSTAPRVNAYRSTPPWSRIPWRLA